MFGERLNKRIKAIEVTDLPDPDSPTRPSVSPLNKVKDKELTAIVHLSSWRNRMLKFLTSNIISDDFNVSKIEFIMSE